MGWWWGGWGVSIKVWDDCEVGGGVSIKVWDDGEVGGGVNI